jgi:SOS-response transcriptional repressor LexA
MSLGKIIRHRREELGLTQDQVALRSGISKPYLSNIETGRAKNPPTDAVLERLERALDLEPMQLMHAADLARTPPYVLNEFEMRGAELEKLRSVVRAMLADGRAEGSGGVDLDALAGRLNLDDPPPALADGGFVPVINRVAAGYPQEFTDLDYPPSVADEYIRCPDLNDPQAFAARVVGDSMAPAYREGDLVVFSPNTQPQNGDDCFVRFAEDGTTFKRYFLDDVENSGLARKIRLQPINNRYPAESYNPDQITGLWPAVLRIEKIRGRP